MVIPFHRYEDGYQLAVMRHLIVDVGRFIRRRRWRVYLTPARSGRLRKSLVEPPEGPRGSERLPAESECQY